MPLGPGMFRDIMRRPGSNVFGESGKRALRRRAQKSRLTAPTPRELPRPSGGVMGPGRSRGRRFGLNFDGFGPRRGGFRGGLDSLRQFVPNLRSYR